MLPNPTHDGWDTTAPPRSASAAMLSFRYQISRSELVRLHHENATARSEATQTRYAARIEEAQEQHGELVSHMLNQAAFQAASAPALYLC